MPSTRRPRPRPRRRASWTRCTALVITGLVFGSTVFGPADMAMLFAGIAHAAALAGDVDRTLRQRYLAIVLDGLRPLDPPPLPGRPLSFAELRRRKGHQRT